MNYTEIFFKNDIKFTSREDAIGDVVMSISKDDLYKTAEILKNNRYFNFDMLLSVIGVDCSDKFEVLYNLYSTINNKKFTLSVELDRDNPKIESLCGLYNSANWHERECFDLFGIEFLNHPKLQRILLPKDWKGYPLRKDYKQDDERLVWNKR